jgi:hypothetical protein
MSLPASVASAFLGMSASMKKLQDRLAPDNPTMMIVKCNRGQHTPGTTIASLALRGPFNTIVNNLQAGNVDIYFGGGGGQPDLVLHPTDNPLIIPLGRRTDPVVTFIVDVNSPGAAQGSILLEYY